MISKGAVTLIGAQGSESIFGKDSLTAFNSSGYTKLISTGWIKLVKCHSLGHVTGKDFVKVLNCRDIQSIYSEHDLDLINSIILGDVKFGGMGLFKNSKVEGAIISPAMDITLDNTTVKSVYIKKAKLDTEHARSLTKVAYMLNRPATPIRQVRFGNSSVSAVSTPIHTYAFSGVNQPQTITLLNNSIVKDAIRFENGNGKVYISRSQPFKAIVEGGEIEYLK